jgi:hypothetical protein
MDNKERLYRELGDLLDNYSKARLIEQNINFDVLRFMNLEALVNIVNSNTMHKHSTKSKLVYLSYEDILTKTQTSLLVYAKYIHRLKDKVDVSVISAMTRASASQIRDIHNLDISTVINMSYAEIIMYDITKDTIKLSQSHMTTLINSILVTGYMVADISKDTLILSEMKTVVHKGVETRMQPCLIGTPVPIPPSDRHAASLYMKFMTYALTDMYEDHLDVFIENIHEIERIANGPAKGRLLGLLDSPDRQLDADDLYNMFYVNRITDNINKSSSARLQSDDYNDFDDPVRVDKNLVVNIQTTDIRIPTLSIDANIYNISEMMTDGNMEMLWLMVEEMYPYVTDKLSSAIVGVANEAVNNVSQHITIAVFPNEDESSVSFNGKDIDVPAGALILLSPGNIIINADEGFVVWFI